MSAVDKKFSKVFNDPIHGHIALHPLCVKIIDTPQFQRLRNLKQLGGCYYVYPGASHNRFEHSIGVCHLAGQLVTHLQKIHPDLKIRDQDVLCVKIAGLCHDLGHGPFSHLFDKLFIPKIRKQLGSASEEMKNWKHEKASIDMFNSMLDDEELHKQFTEAELSEDDIDFIKDLIKPEKERTNRLARQSFLYEIVANELNSIDVDKWDYFARDSFYLGIAISFDFRRYMELTRVIEHEGKLQICIRDKEASSVCDMFQSRMSLHWRAYQHKATQIIEYMISEAMVLANEHITVKVVEKTRKALESADEKVVEKIKVKMSDTIFRMDAYMKLDDSIFQKILHSSNTESKVRAAQKILGRIINRQLYKFIGETELSDPEPKGWKKSLKKKLKEYYDKCEDKSAEGLDLCDFVVLVAIFDYGKKGENSDLLKSPCNPVNHVKIYKKSTPEKAEPIDSEKLLIMLPRKFTHKVCRVYCKPIEPEVWKTLRKVFTDHYDELEGITKASSQQANQTMSQDISPGNETARGAVKRKHSQASKSKLGDDDDDDNE